MRHRNNVKQLNRSRSHRKAMFGNMVTSLFLHERIITTKQKGKELKRISDKIITRAKKNLAIDDSNIEKKLHNKREVMKLIKDRKAITKLFDNIAPRFKKLESGYTRMFLLGRRPGDSAEMAIVELVIREKSKTKEEKSKDEGKSKKEEKSKKEAKAKKEVKEKKDKVKEEKSKKEKK